MQVLFKVKEEGRVETVEEFKVICQKLIDSRMKFCPGVSLEEYEGYKEVIRYDQKKVLITTEPFKRVASVDCLLWFPITRYASREKKVAAEVVCTACVTLIHDLREAKKRLSCVTSEDKVQHQQASSNYPLKYLSPTSLNARQTNIKSQRAKERRIMRKYAPDDIFLDDIQHEEMTKVQEVLEDVAGSELEALFDEGDQTGSQVGTTLRQIWEDDKRGKHEASTAEFKQDQERNRKYQ